MSDLAELPVELLDVIDLIAMRLEALAERVAVIAELLELDFDGPPYREIVDLPDIANYQSEDDT